MNDAIHDSWEVSSLNWHQIKPPMRPCEVELALITRRLTQQADSSGLNRVLVLGATPEYFHLPWPRHTRVSAADSSPAMLARVWPGAPDSTIEADWQKLPLANNSQDMVLLDAGLCLLSWPVEQTRVVSEIARVLRPGGLGIIRLLVLPAIPQSPAQVYTMIRRGLVPNLSHLRLYLWMALQSSNGRAATNQDIWGGLKKEFGSWAALAQAVQCDAHYLEQFAETRLTQAWPQFDFATQTDYADLFRQPAYGLAIEEIFRPDYPLGERCPTFVLRKT